MLKNATDARNAVTKQPAGRPRLRCRVCRDTYPADQFGAGTQADVCLTCARTALQPYKARNR